MPISTGKRGSGSGSSYGVSAQQQVLDLFLDAIQRVENILIEDYTTKDRDAARMEAFQLQMMCLRKLVPDRGVQDRIKKAIDAKMAEYEREKTFTSKNLMYYASHMETFTEVMVYLNEGMDLIHHDITGTMTSRAAEAALEPDKKPKRLHPDEFKIVRKALLLDEIVPVDWPNPANTSLDLPPAEPASDPLEGRGTETPPLQLEWEGEDHE